MKGGCIDKYLCIYHTRIKCQKKDGTAKTKFCGQVRAREKMGDMLTNIQVHLGSRNLCMHENIRSPKASVRINPCVKK